MQSGTAQDISGGSYLGNLYVELEQLNSTYSTYTIVGRTLWSKYTTKDTKPTDDITKNFLPAEKDYLEQLAQEYKVISLNVGVRFIALMPKLTPLKKNEEKVKSFRKDAVKMSAMRCPELEDVEALTDKANSLYIECIEEYLKTSRDLIEGAQT